jgi:hypothetical protein
MAKPPAARRLRSQVREDRLALIDARDPLDYRELSWRAMFGYTNIGCEAVSRGSAVRCSSPTFVTLNFNDASDLTLLLQKRLLFC